MHWAFGDLLSGWPGGNVGRKTTVAISLDLEADRDILRWLEQVPKGDRSRAIREAIRDHLGRGGVTLGDVYQAVKALEQKLQAGVGVVVTDASDSDEWDEPPEAAAALEALAEP